MSLSETETEPFGEALGAVRARTHYGRADQRARAQEHAFHRALSRARQPGAEIFRFTKGEDVVEGRRRRRGAAERVQRGTARVGAHSDYFLMF